MLKYIIKKPFNRRACCVCKGCYHQKCIVRNKQEDKTKIKVIVAEETHKGTVVSFDGIASKHGEVLQVSCSAGKGNKQHWCPESKKLEGFSHPACFAITHTLRLPHAIPSLKTRFKQPSLTVTPRLTEMGGRVNQPTTHPPGTYRTPVLT